MQQVFQLEVPGGRLHVEQRGRPAPRGQVFIHGFSLDARMWDAQWEHIRDDQHAVRFDMRGYGRSSLPDGPYAPIADLLAVLDATGITRADLVGLSRGGSLALDFTLAHPDRVERLVLVDTVLGGWPWSAGLRALDQAVWDIAKRDGVEAGKRAWLAHPILSHAMARDGARRQIEAMVRDWSGWQFLHRDPAQHPKPPAAMRLKELARPTLVIVGANDLPDFLGIADAIATDAPEARKAVMAGVGHLPPMEAPEAFTRVVDEFLD